jgi:hypothetical protein
MVVTSRVLGVLGVPLIMIPDKLCRMTFRYGMHILEC